MNKDQRALVSGITQSFPSFIEWAWRLVDPSPFVENWHIWRICEYLQAVIEGDIPRLLINIPPGHQKSLTVCVFLNAWAWIERPELRFMFTSYRGDLALRDADRTRMLIRDRRYQNYFGDKYSLRVGQDTKGRYETDKKGYRFSSSISGIMGEGGDIVVLDDPHNVETAESDEVRDETVRKINLALPTRVRSKKGGVIVIMQRLHERDFAGSAINEGDWVHLCLPARYEHDHPFVSRTIFLPSGKMLRGDDREKKGIIDAIAKLKKAELKTEALVLANRFNGELLFPDLFPDERVGRLETTMGSYGAAGQLQQRPAPREGGMFQRSWFDDQFIEAKELPRYRLRIRGYDLAGSTRKASPYTAAVKLSLCTRAFKTWKVGDIFIEHVERYRGTPGQVEKRMKSRAKADGKITTIDIPQDPGQAGKSQVKALVRLLAGWTVRFSPESGSKEQRAEPLSAQCEAGNVYIVRGAWNDDYLDELTIFPGSTYKDQVDASSRAYDRLLQLGGTASSGVSSGSY